MLQDKNQPNFKGACSLRAKQSHLQLLSNGKWASLAVSPLKESQTACSSRLCSEPLSTTSLSSTELCWQSSSPPYFCSIAYLPTALMVSTGVGGQVSTCRKQKAKGKKNPQPQIQMLCFPRLHNFLKLAFVSNSYYSSGEQSQITAIKTEIILIPVLHNHKSTYNIHHLNLTVRFGFSLLLHLLEI